MIYFDISSASFSYTGGTFSPTVFYENTAAGGDNNPVCPDWITYSFIGSGEEGTTLVTSYGFTAATNTGGVRYGYIEFGCTDRDGHVWSNRILVTQGSSEIVYAPIWKDTYYYASHLDVFEYSLKYNGVSVYFGKAYCAPGAGGPMVQVNKLCQNFLKNNVELTEGVHSNDGAYGLFSLCNSEGLELCNYVFLMDYGSDWNGYSPYAMTEPINGHLDPRMYLMYTEYNSNETVINYEIND